ncbi:MAG: hypothetical protein D6723_13105 [Acidobacteria bacterium]|nr:MAG: hypothetical protein D6723_13105 [Acidobacteriota bacterium]
MKKLCALATMMVIPILFTMMIQLPDLALLISIFFPTAVIVAGVFFLLGLAILILGNPGGGPGTIGLPLLL